MSPFSPIPGRFYYGRGNSGAEVVCRCKEGAPHWEMVILAGVSIRGVTDHRIVVWTEISRSDLPRYLYLELLPPFAEELNP